MIPAGLAPAGTYRTPKGKTIHLADPEDVTHEWGMPPGVYHRPYWRKDDGQEAIRGWVPPYYIVTEENMAAKKSFPKPRKIPDAGKERLAKLMEGAAKSLEPLQKVLLEGSLGEDPAPGLAHSHVVTAICALNVGAKNLRQKFKRKG